MGRAALEQATLAAPLSFARGHSLPGAREIVQRRALSRRKPTRSQWERSSAATPVGVACRSIRSVVACVLLDTSATSQRDAAPGYLIPFGPRQSTRFPYLRSANRVSDWRGTSPGS